MKRGLEFWLEEFVLPIAFIIAVIWVGYMMSQERSTPLPASVPERVEPK